MSDSVSQPAANNASKSAPIAGVLFDLDGTLADTAPDLAFALNKVLQSEGREPLPFAAIRPFVSHGGVALLRFGFELNSDVQPDEQLQQRFLNIYRENLYTNTKLFSGIPELLSALEQRQIPWGVVTNKPAWLTEPLLEGLAIANRAACIVSGDTLPQRKPDPEPMCHACELVGIDPGTALYVGDAERDIAAGRAAGMTTLIASFGYIGAHETPENWGANGAIDTPLEILEWLQ